MKLVEYIKETRGEMKHVNWPTRSQALNYTLLVIALSVVTAIILSVADYVFGLGLEKLLFNR
jgi:preprotein translocase subunit SecE